jgi:ribokinase
LQPIFHEVAQAIYNAQQSTDQKRLFIHQATPMSPNASFPPVCRRRRFLNAPTEAMAATPPAKHIAVTGSLNADLVFTLQRVPHAGETLAARSFTVHPGGKVRVVNQRCPLHFPCVTLLDFKLSVPHMRSGRQPGGGGSLPRLPHQAHRASGAGRPPVPHVSCCSALVAISHLLPACDPRSSYVILWRRLRTALEGCGVDTALVRGVDGPCGTAVILLEEDGE